MFVIITELPPTIPWTSYRSHIDNKTWFHRNKWRQFHVNHTIPEPHAVEVSDRFRTRGPARLHMGLLPLPVCHIYCHDKPGKHLFNTKGISWLMYVVMNGSHYSLYNSIILKFAIIILSSDTIRQYDKFKRQLLNSNHRCLFIFLIIVYSKLWIPKKQIVSCIQIQDSCVTRKSFYNK